MTINQARSLRPGTLVHNITTKSNGIILKHGQLGVLVGWYCTGQQYYYYHAMNSIHVMAN